MRLNTVREDIKYCYGEGYGWGDNSGYGKSHSHASKKGAASMSVYDKQAQDFLDKFGLAISRRAHSCMVCPPWTACDKEKTGLCPKCGTTHGNPYLIKITRNLKPSEVLDFYFWGSYNDAKKGKSPSKYSILSSIGGDSVIPETFHDFCWEFGYNEDSRRDYSNWERCSKFAKKLRAFFTADELEALREIHCK